jgi:isochorismate synthase
LRTEPNSASAGPELPALSEHLEYCDQAFAEARKRGARIVRLSVAAPVAPLLSQPAGSMLWCQSGGTQWIGSGQAAQVRGEGLHRYQEIKVAAAKLWRELYDQPHSSAKPDLPRLFGGLSFASTAPSEPWSNFGQGLFWLPRTLYAKFGQGASLSLCADLRESPVAIAKELYEEQRRLSLAGESVPRQAQIEQAEHLDPEEWSKRIEGIRAAIRGGAVHKVVAARMSRLHFRDGIELRPALERLTERYPDCYRFAFQRGDSTFLGASPETLIDKCGLRVSTQALAGSIAADLPDAAAKLLASKKDRFEQNLVVEAIVAALEPLCSEMQSSAMPETRTLRHLTHLCTPIQGRLQHEQHVLDLVEALHPTPAVGGSPVREAMKWIAESEEDRGWYAGPVGWFDSAGDGHFAVAIRSALFSGSDALVYAGAGIVADSDPKLEYQETGLKQRAILDALGILG